ncbi:MAG: STAS-like domain-containing protein [Deltaproteobacteria bacterium]|nr:STAS-like domain-containing protein [Deltaproteobacteria bacterium]
MTNIKDDVRISIAQDYTITPSARYKKDGPFSGEDFRETCLEKHFENKEDNYRITIVLDGVEGFATSFLEEAFGGLARKFGKKRCLARLNFISEEDRLLVDEIREYIEASTNE